MEATPIPTKRWARVEYERLVDRAVFQPGDSVSPLRAPRASIPVADLLP